MKRGFAVFGGTGCLGCLGIALVTVICVGGIAFAVFGVLKSSDVFQDALARARANRALVAELGEPIQDGWIVTVPRLSQV